MIGNPAEGESSPYVSATKHTFALSDSLSVRIFANNNPKNLKIADLQKGLILICDGIEVIGEGTGFGVPVVKYSDETFFSGSSCLHVKNNANRLEIRKEFLMNLVARDRFRNLKLENPKIRAMFDYISILYQRHGYLARSILIMKSLFFGIGLKSSFKKSPHRGKVVVTYIIDRKRISVKLNLGLLDQTNLRKIFILNEQGAHFFRTYSDSDGLRLVDEQIGAWQEVLAQSARMADAESKIGFNLNSVEGSILRRGRERMKESLDWVGLDYELAPNHHQFEYEIELYG